MLTKDVGVLTDQGEHWLAGDSEQTAVETAECGGGESRLEGGLRRYGDEAEGTLPRVGTLARVSCPSSSLHGLPKCLDFILLIK